MKKIMMFLLLPTMTLASSPVFFVRTTAHFCYEDFSDAVVRAEKSLEEQANLICHDREAIKQAVLQYAGGLCSVKLEATYICQ